MVSPLLTYRSGDISETTLMELSSNILNSWNKTHSGILLELQYDEKGSSWATCLCANIK